MADRPGAKDSSEQSKKSPTNQRFGQWQSKPSSTSQSTAHSTTKPPQSTANKASTGNTSSTTPQRVQTQAQYQVPGNADFTRENTRDRLATSGTNPPSWPTPPRLKSPPPATGRNTTSKHEFIEQTPSNTAKRLAPVSAPDLAAVMLMSPAETSQSQQTSNRPPGTSHLRVPGRGSALETVAEGSVPTTPSIEPRQDPMESSQKGFTETDSANKTERSSASSSVVLSDPAQEETTPRASRNVPPASTSKAEPENKSRASSATRSASALAKRSFTNLVNGKRDLDSSGSSLAPPDRRETGSVRAKTSTETIRPKKERKKAIRKPMQGASKADIFEAKVASAVDDADTSDSDETFVYESNPPESRSYRHHSRTPSATSVASTHDHYRNKSGMRNGSSAISGKKSMKFGNSLQLRENEDDANRARAGNSTPRQHVGRATRNSHVSLFDSDSPFGQRAPASPRNATGSLRNSRPNSPRIGNGRLTSPRKYGGHAYDNNEDIADDERTPLMGTVRGSRNRHSKRPHSRDLRSLEMGEETDRSCWRRCTSCILLGFVLIVICAGLGLFAMAVNRPLIDVEIRRITNVIATEQELMLDLDVRAANPNLFAVMVSDLDVNLFAQSPYVGTGLDWQREHLDRGHGHDQKEDFSENSWFWPEPPHSNDGVDHGTDPDDDGGIQKMLLGQVSVFDSPLTFEPAPVRRSLVSSTGGIRLSKPGNKTEVGGSDRWSRVLQHDFDLLVQGVIKYQLPFSSKVRRANIRGRKTVEPDNDDNDTKSV